MPGDLLSGFTPLVVQAFRVRIIAKAHKIRFVFILYSYYLFNLSNAGRVIEGLNHGSVEAMHLWSGVVLSFESFKFDESQIMGPGLKCFAQCVHESQARGLQFFSHWSVSSNSNSSSSGSRFSAIASIAIKASS